MSFQTPGILNLHIWSMIKWAALRTGQNRSINSIVRGCTEIAVLSSIEHK